MTLRPFGTTPDGADVHEALLTLPNGTAAAIIGYGAIVRDLQVPGPKGPTRVVLGHRTLADYLSDNGHMGAIAGRYANRIANGRFTLDGRAVQVTRNERGVHHLHGGDRGFGRRVWSVVGHDATSVTLTLTSPDGEEGFPGTVEVRCIYRLVPPATLAVELTASSDATTVVNLAHHSYFTLNYGRSIRDHVVQINASHFTPTDASLIPTGRLAPVAGTPYDFRKARPLSPPDIVYDINFVLDRDTPGLQWAASVAAPDGTLRLDVYTTEPGLQLYDGSFLQETAGLDGRPHFRSAGLCLEPQKFPDSPNHPQFPSPVLHPGEVYAQRTEYRFSAHPKRPPHE